MFLFLLSTLIHFELPYQIRYFQTKQTEIHPWVAHHSKEKSCLFPIQINLQLHFLCLYCWNIK